MTLLETDVRTRRDESKPLAHYDEAHAVLWLGGVPIPFRRGEQSNADLLRSLAGCIREIRGLASDAPCPLRETELATFAQLLDLGSRPLRRDIRQHLGLNKREAGDLVARLRRARQS